MAATGQSAAGGAASGQASGDGGAQGFDAGALQQQLQATSTGVDDLRSQFGAFSQQLGQFVQGQQDADIDLSHLDEGFEFDPGIGYAEAETHADQQAEAATGLAGLIHQQAAAAVAPAMEQVAELRREQAIRDLVAEFPQFHDAEYAHSIAGPNGLAVQYAEQMGQPALAMDPSFWRVVHMAHANAQAANAEEDAEVPGAAMLEGAGGGNGGGSGRPDVAGQIIGGAGRKGASVLPYH